MMQLVQRLCLTWLTAVPPPACEKSFASMETPSQPDSAIRVEFAVAPSKANWFPVIQALETTGYDSNPPDSSTPACPLQIGAQLLLCRIVLFWTRTPVENPTAISATDWPRRALAPTTDRFATSFSQSDGGLESTRLFLTTRALSPSPRIWPSTRLPLMTMLVGPLARMEWSQTQSWMKTSSRPPACQQRYRCHLEKNATQMPAIAWQLTSST